MRNKSVKEWLEIKEYLLSEEVIDRWIQNPPNVRLYYVVMGKWRGSQHIEAISSQLKEDIKNMNVYQDVFLQYVDTEAFKKICNDNDNYYTCTLNTIDMFALPEVDKVEDSLIVLFSASELLRMLDTGEGIIRKALFNDNVRDFQGDTTINEEVYQTLQGDPKSFILLNNGITIICDTMLPSNRKIKITNPQIVNGCQTCNLLYKANQKGIDCDGVTLFAKVIATNEESEITNRIVKSTNRQNIVYDEAFEITKDFHKELEELFQALSAENKDYPLYYERRSKQFSNMPSIKVGQKANFTTLIQSFVSIFLDEPYLGHRHPNVLLQRYQNKLFVVHQNKYPYYLSALLFTRIENEFRSKGRGLELKTYKSHLALLFKLISCGQSPDINKTQPIEEYCVEFSQFILSDKAFEETYLKAVDFLKIVIQRWVKTKGESFKYGIKDSIEFTNFLISEYLSQNASEPKQEEQPVKYRGRVIKTSLDRNGYKYGFISKNPNNVFFHSTDNPTIDMNGLLQKEVLYNIQTDSLSGKTRAIDIELV